MVYTIQILHHLLCQSHHTMPRHSMPHTVIHHGVVHVPCLNFNAWYLYFGRFQCVIRISTGRHLRLSRLQSYMSSCDLHKWENHWRDVCWHCSINKSSASCSDFTVKFRCKRGICCHFIYFMFHCWKFLLFLATSQLLYLFRGQVTHQDLPLTSPFSQAFHSCVKLFASSIILLHQITTPYGYCEQVDLVYTDHILNHVSDFTDHIPTTQKLLLTTYQQLFFDTVMLHHSTPGTTQHSQLPHHEGPPRTQAQHSQPIKLSVIVLNIWGFADITTEEARILGALSDIWLRNIGHFCKPPASLSEKEQLFYDTYCSNKESLKSEVKRRLLRWVFYSPGPGPSKPD